MVLVRACLTNARMLASSMNHMHDVYMRASLALPPVAALLPWRGLFTNSAARTAVASTVACRSDRLG
jgi:hypothetical protein